jgi:hypothetical protein
VGAGPIPPPSAAVADDGVVRRPASARPVRREARRPTASGPGQVSHRTGDRSGLSARLARTLDWQNARRGVRISVLAVSLVALSGATYLGARSYLSQPGAVRGRGTLVIESRPTGIEVFIDGRSSGRTPVTLDLQAGEHTVLLRSGRSITLVPVVVVSGARHVERVDIRPRQTAPRVPAPAPPAALPPPGHPE